MFPILGFNKHQILVADVRQSMFLFQMGVAISAEEGPVLDVANLVNTSAADTGLRRCALVMILQ
jgi:hypothetical protein